MLFAATPPTDKYSNEVVRKLIHLLSRDNREKEKQLLYIAYNSVRKKWPDTLFQLYGQTKINDNLINISWEDPAAMTCIATETVSCTLSDFNDQQIIDRNGTKISVLNHEGLSKIKN